MVLDTKGLNSGPLIKVRCIHVCRYLYVEFSCWVHRGSGIWASWTETRKKIKKCLVKSKTWNNKTRCNFMVLPSPYYRKQPQQLCFGVNWLVVYLPLWKVLVIWDDHSQYIMGKKKFSNHQLLNSAPKKNIRLHPDPPWTEHSYRAQSSNEQTLR